MSKLTAEYIRTLFHYDPLSGIFTWLVANGPRARVGGIVGSVNQTGYVETKLDGKKYKLHRLVWLYMTGEWPKDHIDHINGIRSDNRWSNLRPATHQQNMMNVKKRSNNTSGFKGVTWSKRDKKWQAQIMLDGKQYQIGSFDTPEEASECYEGAASILFGHYKRTTIIEEFS